MALKRYKYTYYLRKSEQNFNKNVLLGDNYLLLCLLCPFLLEGWWGNATNSIKEQERKIAPLFQSMFLRNSPALQGRAGEGPYSLTFGRAIFATRHSSNKFGFARRSCAVPVLKRVWHIPRTARTHSALALCSHCSIPFPRLHSPAWSRRQ